MSDDKLGNKLHDAIIKAEKGNKVVLDYSDSMTMYLHLDYAELLMHVNKIDYKKYGRRFDFPGGGELKFKQEAKPKLKATTLPLKTD